MSSVDHETLNLNAFLALEGMRSRPLQRLIELFASDAPISPEVRSKIAAALSKTKNDPGIRLDLAGTGSADSDNIGRLVEVRRRWLIAGEKIIELTSSEGISIAKAKTRLDSLIDDEGRAFGFEISQAGDAWAYYKGWLEFEKSALATESAELLFGGNNVKWHMQHAYILNTIRDIIERVVERHDGFTDEDLYD